MDRRERYSATDDRDHVPKDPAHRNFLVYCDESGIDGAQKYVGFGSVWLPHERRGNLTALINDCRTRHRYWDEIKWNKVSSTSAPFYRALIEAFFRTPWIAFHCIIVRKQLIDPERHESKDEALLKFFAHFLANKIKRSASLDGDRRYYVRVDPLPSSYKKAHEAEHNIIASMIKSELGKSFIEALDVRDSRGTPGIQLADLLLGATLGHFQDMAKSAHKQSVMNWLAEHLGWKNLRADTFPTERKFNVWYFYDPRGGPRELSSRGVELKYPLRRTAFPQKISTKRG
jgi:hypothetical protein